MNKVSQCVFCQRVTISRLLPLVAALTLTVGRTALAAGNGASDSDTIKVLIVFVMFSDDNSPDDPTVYYRGWPLFEDRSRLPLSAPHLLSSSPDPPFVDSTLSAYYYVQSGGRLILYGDVHPRTIVSSEPEAAYHAPSGGYGRLAQDVIRQLDRQGVDFADYDHDRDGVLDHLFIVLRGDSAKDSRRITWTGASCLDARCANGPPKGPPVSEIHVDGVRIDWNLSGSIVFNRVAGNVSPQYWLVRMMAHEIGHDLWRRFFVHVPAITDNDVPAESNFRPATRTLGYVLMAGAGGGYDARGDETISAFERDLLGWIDCRVLAQTVSNVAVRDLYTTGDCVKLETGDVRRPRSLYLSVRTRTGPFDRYRRAGTRGQYEMGLLRTEGLLITIADRRRFDVIPADNSLHLSPENGPYQGDMFGPGTMTQLTPWTRPNINGYNRNPQRLQPHWHAIDAIRWEEDRPDAMRFDYLEDFRLRPVVREDSWITGETGPVAISGGLVVTGTSTLSIETDVTLTGVAEVQGSATLRVAPDAVLTLDPQSAIIIRPGGRVIVDGTLIHPGIISGAAGSRFRIGTSGSVRIAR